tara:strand:- start:59 stop:235 length:177 start_codon:yes stop_codon:yes gene_type:complete
MTFTYKLQKRSGETEVTAITKFITGTNRAISFPIDNDCNEYREYLEWVEAGNTADGPD